MNNSVDEIQAVFSASQNAAQAIAKLDKPNDCAKTPRTAVGLPSDSDRHYDLDELRACGFDAMAATIVHHIKYNTKRHKCAKAYTSSYWMEFFGGCSKKQARTAVKNALAATMNEVPLLALSHGYFNGVWSPHYLYVGSGADLGTPHADLGTPCTEGNQQKETENLNIKDAGAGNTPASTTAESIKQSGKVKTPKKPEASQPVLDLCLNQKKEFLKLNQNADKHPGNLSHELTVADRDIAQRFEHRLTQAGIDAVEFFTWLTPGRFQGLTLDLCLNIGYALLWMGDKDNQTYLMDAYRAYLDNLPPCAKKAPAQITTPTPAPAPIAEPVVAHYLDPDDFEECQEPPDDYPKAAKTPTELMREDLLRQQQAKAKGIKFTAAANMWQHGKGKHAKAA